MSWGLLTGVGVGGRGHWIMLPAAFGGLVQVTDDKRK